MSPIHKFVSFFQSDSKNSRKNLVLQQKTFSSELNIYSEFEDYKKNPWGTLSGYRRTKGNLLLSLDIIVFLLF